MKRSTVRAAGRAAKSMGAKKLAIIVIAIVLILAVTIGLLWYFGVLDEVIELITSGGNDGNNSNNGNGGSSGLLTGDGNLQIHFVDVGQGDCILILFPDGKDMLIDWGNASSGYDRSVTESYLAERIPDGQLDYLMLTHGDADHVEYLDNVLETYDVDNIYMPYILAAPNGTGTSAQELRDQIADLPSEQRTQFADEDVLVSAMYAEFFVAALTEPEANIHLNVGTYSIETETYKLTFYAYSEQEWADTDLSSAEEKNAISPIGVLEYNNRKIVLTGDSNELNEPKFVDKVGGTELDCDVLKVGHHGSRTSSTAEFLDFIKCEYAVISCNYLGNTYGHPTQEALDRLEARDMTVYRTDLHGNIVLTVNGSGELNFTTQKTADENQLFVGRDS